MPKDKDKQLQKREYDQTRPDKDHGHDLRTLTAYERQVLYEEIARRMLERHSTKRICADLAISSSTLSRILRSSAFRKTFDKVKSRVIDPVEAALRDERMQIQDRVNYGTQRALTEAFRLLESARSEHVRARVAMALLDRHPETAPIRRNAGERRDTVALVADASAIETLARAINAAAGDVVTVEAVESPDAKPDAKQEQNDA